MGVCIPNRKSSRIANLSKSITKTIIEPKKRHSFFNNAFFNNDEKHKNKKINPQKDDNEILEKLLKKKKPKYTHMHSPLIRPKRENYHNSQCDESFSINTLEGQNLRKILHRSINLFKEPNNTIKNKDMLQSKKNKGTNEFMRNNYSLEKVQSFDYFMPDKRTFGQELLETLPHIKLKWNSNSNFITTQKINRNKIDEKRSSSVNKIFKLEKTLEIQSSLLKRRINQSVSNQSINQNKIPLSSNARIKPSKEYKAQIQAKPNSGLFKMMERFKNKTTPNDNLRVLHEGKVIILKKNNIIIRNDKVLKII